MNKYNSIFESDKKFSDMSIEELYDERDKLLNSQIKADFIDPKIMRKVQEIDNLIFDISKKIKKGKRSQRTISFTRDRR